MNQEILADNSRIMDEARGIETESVSLITVDQRIDYDLGTEEIRLDMQAGQPGEYDTALGPLTILDIAPVEDPKSRAQMKVAIAANGWLQKSDKAQPRNRRAPRRVYLIDGIGRQQLPPSEGRKRWLVVTYREPQM